LWWLVDARSDWGEAVDVVQLDEKNVVFRARVKRAERRLLRRGVAVASWWRESPKLRAASKGRRATIRRRRLVDS
jgi:hypothetical protein